MVWMQDMIRTKSLQQGEKKREQTDAENPFEDAGPLSNIPICFCVTCDRFAEDYI